MSSCNTGTLPFFANRIETYVAPAADFIALRKISCLRTITNTRIQTKNLIPGKVIGNDFEVYFIVCIRFESVCGEDCSLMTRQKSKSLHNSIFRSATHFVYLTVINDRAKKKV